MRSSKKQKICFPYRRNLTRSSQCLIIFSRHPENRSVRNQWTAKGDGHCCSSVCRSPFRLRSLPHDSPQRIRPLITRHSTPAAKAPQPVSPGYIFSAAALQQTTKNHSKRESLQASHRDSPSSRPALTFLPLSRSLAGRTLRGRAEEGRKGGREEGRRGTSIRPPLRGLLQLSAKGWALKLCRRDGG